MQFVCSECKCEVIFQNGSLICTGCGRKRELSSPSRPKEVDMNDNTKDKNVLFG